MASSIAVCSTPFGVIVGFCIGPLFANTSPMAPAQRPSASSSVSHRSSKRWLAEGRLLNAFGVIVGFASTPEIVSRPSPSVCSTPFGVIVGFRLGGVRGPRPGASESAQRLSASSSGSPYHEFGHVCGYPLLNAFRRHRRVRPSPTGRPPSLPHSAQRLSASSSVFRERIAAPPVGDQVTSVCSTPFGVIVGFAGRSRRRWGSQEAAQRLSASSSGSRAGRQLPARELALLNAFSASSSGSRYHPWCHECQSWDLLQRLRRHRRVRAGNGRRVVARWVCSTPFGVIVGFASTRPAMPRRRTAAQRLSASSSGSPSCTRCRRRCDSLLNAFRRHRRVRRHAA